MTTKPKLEWGQTPYDDLSRDELLVEVWRLHSAVRSLWSCLRNGREPLGHYGCVAMIKGNQALAKANKFDSESVYRSFFRYADDVLFEGLGDGWRVCDRCHVMRSPVMMDESSKGDMACYDCARRGRESTMRFITLADIRNKPGVDQP